MSKVNGGNYRRAPSALLERILAAPFDVNADGCRLWKGRLRRGGYGTISYSVNGRSIYVAVHRLVYVRLADDPGDDFEIDHTCHNPLVCVATGPAGCEHRRCYELSHLEAVPQWVNALRSGSPFAMNARKEQCNDGHVLSGDNLFIFPNGTRGCRECQREDARLTRIRYADEIKARGKAKRLAAHAAREHRCKTCGVDIHHRPPCSKFCELCTTVKPVRRQARMLLVGKEAA